MSIEGIKTLLTAIGCIVALWMLASFMADTFGNPNPRRGTDCRIEYDGRSNPTVCD
jgi:hypothetical protein